MMTQLINNFKAVIPAVDFWSLRFVESEYQRLMVRQDKPEPISISQSMGVHITLINKGGIGYTATSDLTQSGLKLAIIQALQWAALSEQYSLIKPEHYPRPEHSGNWQSQIETSWETSSWSENFDLLTTINHDLHANDKIVDWWAALSHASTHSVLITEENTIDQHFSSLNTMMSALANQGVESQQRSFGLEHSAQVGLEQLANIKFSEQAQHIAEQAQQLLNAPNCPTGARDLILLPSQMTLQIHESIGHPLELDRILGDERNYAGTSFVTEDMFGSFQYGSDILNITFDPENPHQIASYAFDDEGSPAKQEYLIKNGLLQRPLAGHLSQQRANLSGVANSLACDWNRPAIDRMANINLVAGESTLEQMISQTQSGILMDTNRSWSIDDSRNKFQFGCEYAQLIENGELADIVKNPNYRGISSEFWRNLSAVGDQNSYQVLSVPACGKGEPNQAIKVGHASPACLFQNVNVFGGA